MKPNPSLTRIIVLTGVALAALAIFAAAGYVYVASRASHPASPQFVGRVSDSDAFIGINKDGQVIQAYVCDGTAGHISLQEWFNGIVSDAAFDLTSKGHMRVTGVVTGDSIVGTFMTADGTKHTYTANLASGDAGLIRIETVRDGTNWVGGWIQLPGGEQRGPQIIFDYPCGCYSGRRWCRNAAGYWRIVGSC